jgi:4-hydroxy-2-oxoglutarate aldolase
MANACPRACLKAYELVKAGKQSEALKLGGLIARAEWSLGKGGLLGTKYSATKFTGLPDSAALGRKPLPVISDATKAHVEAEVGPLAEVEQALASEGFVGSILRA